MLDVVLKIMQAVCNNLTILLILEPCNLFEGVSMNSMAKRTLGNSGSTVSGVAYVFLHYALLVINNKST